MRSRRGTEGEERSEVPTKKTVWKACELDPRAQVVLLKEYNRVKRELEELRVQNAHKGII